MLKEIKLKPMSSLEKCFLDEHIDQKQAMSSFTVLRGQPLCYQVGVFREDPESRHRGERCRVLLEGPLAEYATVRAVVSMPSHFPCFAAADENYLRRTPGLYPDLLRPLHYQHGITVFPNQLHPLWVEVNLPDDYPSGSYDLTLSLQLASDGAPRGSVSVSVLVSDIALPPQTLIHSEWFYTDCIAKHYGVRVFSERHWQLIESFLRAAVKCGINMILTPVFTPALDTYVGGERPTTQLMDITVEADGSYSFGFDKLDRWIDLCHSVGIKYFEISHFFTQWGAQHAPKFVAKVKGRTKKIFGWETDACGKEYTDFLAVMIPALVAHLEKRGVARNCYFHISDEPRHNHVEQYLRCKAAVAPHVKDYPIIDALSDFAFYESGAAKKPVPHIPRIQPFLDNKVEGLWTYYCGSTGNGFTSRMLAMPLSRTRILGVQLWLYHIEGFLHWGFNFYYSEDSYDRLDPFLYTDGDYFAPSGDQFLVYPGDDGTAWESLRHNAVREAMEDIRLLSLCESRIGREATEKIVYETAGGILTWDVYPRETNYLYRLREALIKAIEA